MTYIDKNADQEIITDANYITNLWQKIVPLWFQDQWWQWIDKTNKKYYFVYNMQNAPYFWITRYDYADWKMTNKTDMTLSWFGTFTSNPYIWTFQGSHSWDFNLFFYDKVDNVSLTTLTNYPITIVWDVVTLWSPNVLPVIASYSICNMISKWSDIYVWYKETATYVIDSWRKRNWTTWSTLTWDALPSSVKECKATSAPEWTGNMQSKFPKYPWWTNFDKYYCYYYYNSSSLTTMKFDISTETRSFPWFWNDNIWIDINWYIFAQYLMITPSGDEIPFMNSANLSLASDIVNWILGTSAGADAYYFSWFYAWENARIRRIAWTVWVNQGMLYSLDDWVTRKALRYITTMISDNYNLDYVGDIKAFAFYPSPTQYITVEIVK